ncbi:MAG: transcription elongation factor GreA [Deltaproteobacteria bacterium]|nr:transcription elongation factor GreA [Deltaproteobacteria bacterium]
MNLTHSIPMTPTGHRRLQEQLKQLKTAALPAAIQALATARAHGDLSENAEYDAAKSHHEQLLKQISDLERKLTQAHIIDPSSIVHERIVFGATVQLRDADNGDELTYQLVGTDESDLKQGKISVESPIGRALIGKGEGDEVTVKTPKGERAFEILKINYC